MQFPLLHRGRRNPDLAGNSSLFLAMDGLGERAAAIREALLKSQSNTDNMVSVLGSFDHRLSALEITRRPTQEKTDSMRLAVDNIDKTVKYLEIILAQFDLFHQAEDKILRGPHEDLESYLNAMDQLRSIVRNFGGKESPKSSMGVVKQAKTLLRKAILKLEEEFRYLLASHSKPAEPDCLVHWLTNYPQPSTSDGILNFPKNSDSLEAVLEPPSLISPIILRLLHDIAQQMIQTNHHQQLCDIYREIRAPFVEHSLINLGIQKLCADNIQKMQWGVIEAQIGNWVLFMKTAVRVLFSGERKVCDLIFEGINTLGDHCFAEVTVYSVQILLHFGEAVAKSKRAPERLFILLDMYDSMKELQPEIDTIFGSKYCAKIPETAVVLTKLLAQTAQKTLRDFEEGVEKDAVKNVILDASVHALTSYAVNYIKNLSTYQSLMKQAFGEFDGGDAEAWLVSSMKRMMGVLQSNLEGKSKQFKDPALAEIFLMNNMHFIVRSVRSKSKTKDLLGEDWVQVHRRTVEQHAKQYKRLSWSKILQCLTVEGRSSSGGGSSCPIDGHSSHESNGGSSNGGVSKSALKEKFKSFNSMLEEIHQRQSQWTVPDNELREHLRLSVAEIVVPAYRSFLKRFGPIIEGGKNPRKYIKYGPEDLERKLDDFFGNLCLLSEQKR